MRLIILFFLITSISFAQEVKTPNSPQQIPEKKSTGCVSGNCYNGWGKWQYDNGYYSGFWKEGKRNGYGLYDWKDAGKYIGAWEDNFRNGYGVYFYQNDTKDEMIGQFKNGELNGYGKKYVKGKWSQGEYKDGVLVTSHSFYDNKKSFGCIAGDCQNKYGRFKWENGDKFTGFFKNGKMYVGTYVFSNGDKYSGMFVNNSFQGDGRFFFKDGSYYGGKWYNGKYDGLGYFTDAEYNSSIGVWSAGVLVESYK
jgi:hypothetical protein